MNLEEFKDRLRKYQKKDIIVTDHADIQAFSRRIDLEEVKENLINPIRLVYYSRGENENPSEEKYECLFEYNNNLYHKYAIVLNRNIIIVTVIVINRNWQGEIK